MSRGRLNALTAAALRQVDLGLRGLNERVADASRVVGFVRGRLEFVPRDDDIYIVSYPRSGTTWLQFILYLLTSDGSMDFRHISEVTPWFERSLALGRVRADDFARLPAPRVFKSHLPFRWLPGRGRCIYVIRDGMDVAVSYYHLYRAYLGFGGSFDQFFVRFLRGELQYKSWFKHVAGWRAAANNPRVLLLRYEELQQELDACLARIVDFCALPVDAGQLELVRERCSFDYMKRHESKFDHATDLLLARGIEAGRFLRQGRSGGGKAELSPAQREAFVQALARPSRWPEVELDLAPFLH